jgi:outer membrane protein assembly factor BamE
MSKLSRALFIFTVSILLSACFGAYKYDVQQGNIVDQERLSKVEKGMSKRDVQTLLGTPLVRDKFHPNRWDYAYYLKKGRSKETTSRLITLYFENDKLASIAGDVTSGDGTVPDAGGVRVIKIEGGEEEGFFSRTLDDLLKSDK